ncbi:MAG: ArsR family transcriptional regulator [Deltaproteobacteria bacterium]|nr:ArsR family transcriptional regulator [Deltaproteobacteria bacterium]
MTTPVRISAEEVYKRVKSGNALFVCAYDSDEKYANFKIEGSIPFSKFKSMLPGMPKTQEIIFYCA